MTAAEMERLKAVPPPSEIKARIEACRAEEKALAKLLKVSAYIHEADNARDSRAEATR